MQKIIVFEDAGYRDLLPLVYWRTAPELRVGFVSLWERIRRSFPDQNVELFCRPPWAQVAAERLQVPVNEKPRGEHVLLINGRLIMGDAFHPTEAEAAQWLGEDPVVVRLERERMDRVTPEVLLDRAQFRRVVEDLPAHEFVPQPRLVHYPWDLVAANEEILCQDWVRAVGSVPQPPLADPGVHLLNGSAIHVAPTARIYPGCVFDAETGPIFVDDHVMISPHVVIQGPCYIGPESLIRPRAVILPGVSIGRRCKIGGEVGQAIIHAFSNKQHDGFLGHVYVGEWVNLGTDTIVSDLKNTYGHVRVPINGREVDSGRVLVGPTLGDFCKTGIGQLLPTGAVLGVASMVATGGFSKKFVPSFSWLTPDGVTGHDPQRALEVARRMTARRGVSLTPAEEALFLALPALAREHESIPF